LAEIEEFKSDKKQLVGKVNDFEIETLSGKVIVTKNPCSHPGDIRLLTAIGRDDERFLDLSIFCNVVVFPCKGYRPESHKMSGGDLDGDVYMVIWDETLTGSLTPDQIKPPACYKKFVEDKDDEKKDNVDIVDCMK
jgi:RNA-dependent RNA polymerase